MLAVRRLPAVLLTALAAAALAGCAASGSAVAPTTAPSKQTITVGTITAGASTPPATVTSTVGGGTVLAAPPAPTPEPAPIDAPCPYLADDVVADINGQRAGTTRIIEVAPYPVCVFTRVDGEFLASVRIVVADTPQSAVAAVNAQVPIESSDPASQPAGWTGGSMVTETGSIYAVAKGTTAVVAESNQQLSIKGRQLVTAAVANLGL